LDGGSLHQSCGPDTDAHRARHDDGDTNCTRPLDRSHGLALRAREGALSITPSVARVVRRGTLVATCWEPPYPLRWTTNGSAHLSEAAEGAETMSQPQAHPTYSPARSACGPSGDKRGQRPPHHHTLCLLGSAKIGRASCRER